MSSHCLIYSAFLFRFVFFVIFTTVLLCSLDFVINVRHFDIKKLIWNSWIWFHFRNAVVDAISVCALWFEMPSGGIHSTPQSCTFHCHQSWSFIACEGEYLLKWLAKTFVSISNKGSFVPYFLFLKVICLCALVFISIIWFFLKKTLTLNIRLQF